MMDRKSLDVLKTMLADGFALEAPKVDAVVPVIRSGDQMLFRTPGKSWLDKDQRRRLQGRLDVGESAEGTEGGVRDDRNPGQRTLLGEVVVEFGFDASDEADLQFFVSFFEDYLVNVTRAPGLRYRGTYAVYSSTEKSAGKYRTMWSFKGQQAIDRMTAASEPDPDWGITDMGAIVQRLRTLADTQPGAGRSQSWYQPAWGFRA